MAIYFAIHSLLANPSVKAFLIDRFISQKYYRLTYNFLAILLTVPFFLSYRQLPTTLLFSIPMLKWVGGLLIVIGGIVQLLALSQYNLSEFSGTEQLNLQKSPSSSHLKTNGMNAWVRHPLYFGMLLLIWGFFLVHPSDLVLGINLVTSIYLIIGTRLEEQKLIEEFGTEYLDYKRRVGSLLPRLF